MRSAKRAGPMSRPRRLLACRRRPWPAVAFMLACLIPFLGACSALENEDSPNLALDPCCTGGGHLDWTRIGGAGYIYNYDFTYDAVSQDLADFPVTLLFWNGATTSGVYVDLFKHLTQFCYG